MDNQANRTDPVETPVSGSIYHDFLEEREEILRYKWLRSEAHGSDIGFDHALMEWVRFHRREWRESRRTG